MSERRLPIAPARLRRGSKSIVATTFDGDLVRLDPETFEIVDGPARPFPGSIEMLTICGDDIVGFWIENEMAIGRMAWLDSAKGIIEGIPRDELRRWMLRRQRPVPQVEGANWSRTIDRLPLAMTTHGETVVFALDSLGVYCIDSDGAERWRAALPTWEELSNLRFGKEPAAIVSHQESIRVWSIAGGWIDLDDSGDVGADGIVESPDRLLGAWWDDEGGWLVAFANGDLCHVDNEGNEWRHTSNGPAQSAEWIDGRWHVAGWRELIAAQGKSILRKEHQEIVIGFIRTSEESYAVDNQGTLIPTLTE